MNEFSERYVGLVNQQSKSMHVVLVRETSEEYLCSNSETLLQGMARIGRNCIPVGCVNGGCGVCKVVILQGEVHVCNPMSRAHVSIEEEANGIVLACRVNPRSAVVLKVLGKMKKIVC